MVGAVATEEESREERRKKGGGKRRTGVSEGRVAERRLGSSRQGGGRI